MPLSRDPSDFVARRTRAFSLCRAGVRHGQPALAHAALTYLARVGCVQAPRIASARRRALAQRWATMECMDIMQHAKAEAKREAPTRFPAITIQRRPRLG